MGINIFLMKEEGQSMVETALLIALIALAAVGGLFLFGDGLEEYYRKILEKVTAAGN